MKQTMRLPDEPALRFRILGALRIEVDGDEVLLDSPKQRAILAALLVEPDQHATADRLADVVWHAELPEDPAGALYTHVSRLRATLARLAGGLAAEILVTRPPGYALDVDPDSIDARRFERLLHSARGARSATAVDDALGDALALWRGPALTEFEHPQLRVEATRLEDLRVEALERRADALLALDRPHEAVAQLEQACADEPLRESLQGQLMVALYRCDRQVDALDVFRRVRDQLVEDLGLDPSPELRRLERAILRQQDELRRPAPVLGTLSAAAARAATDVADALPAELTSFVGRDEMMAALDEALRARPAVVLTGVGGVGKTRIAVRAARRHTDEYPDGVWYCDLTGAVEATAAESVATSLGAVPGAGRDRVIDLLRAQRSFVILDHCEWAPAAAAGLIERVVRHCPGVRVLAASRVPLDVPGAQHWPVTPMPTDGEAGAPVRQLFVDRALAANPDFGSNPVDDEAVAQICARLDGLPMAVELAAAATRSLSATAIAERLDDGVDALRSTTGRPGLADVFDWTFDRLDERSQRLLARLAVFSGGFTLSAAEAVAAPDRETAVALADLVHHSLVAVEHVGGVTRYRMLECLRPYAAERCSPHDRRGTRRRHTEYFVALAGSAADGLVGPAEARWVTTITAEFGNLRAVHARACAAGDLEVALRLPADLRVYAYHRLHDEVYGWASRALDLPGSESHAARVDAEVVVATGHLQRGQLALAERRAPYGDDAPAGRGRARRSSQLLAELSLYRGRLDAVDRHGRALVDGARADGDDYDEALGHLYRVHAAAYRGDSTGAAHLLARGWRAVGRVDNPTLRAAYHYLEGEVRLDDEPDAAREMLGRAIELAAEVRNRFIGGIARVSLASLEARHGDANASLPAFREIIDHWRRTGDWVHMWTTLHNLLVLFVRLGAPEPAAVLLGAFDTARTGAPPYGADAERIDAARRWIERTLGPVAAGTSVSRGRGLRDEEVVAYGLEVIDGLLREHATV